MTHADPILILDFGSQFTQLIARRVRELNVYCEIHPFSMTIENIRAFAPKGIILSGGPSSVYAADAPIPDARLYDLGVPVLGICYGLQLIAHQHGGAVTKAPRREFGRAQLLVDSGDDIFRHAVEYMLPAAIQFQPDVVAASAGFDAHQFDPLLQLRATGNFFHWIGKTLQETFPGKVFGVLEGGYNVEELPGCVYNFVAGVNGEPLPHPETPTTSGLRIWETYEMYLHQAAGLLMKYWKF